MGYKNSSNVKTNAFLTIFLIVILIITFLSALNPSFGDLFSIGNWFDRDALELVPFWIAVGFTMLACFIGALIPIPVPYAIPVSIFTIIWLDLYGSFAWGLIILLVLFAALANTMGDLIDYLVGVGAEYILSQEDPELQDRWSHIILKKPNLIPGVIFIFGLTPLPDSLLLVPLGVVEYDIKKAAIWMFLGRFFHFLLLFAVAGALALDWAIGGSSNEYGWVYGVILLYVIWLIMVIMVKYKPKNNKE